MGLNKRQTEALRLMVNDGRGLSNRDYQNIFHLTPNYQLASQATHGHFGPDFAYNGHTFVSELDLDAALSAADCVMIVTNHSAYDWTKIADLAKCVVDTRHVVG